MSSEKIKIGVVGVGHLGRWHVQQLKAIPQAELVGIFDIDQEKADHVAQEYHTQNFSDFEKLLNQVDALSIVTPTTTHFEYASRLLEDGKHVFIEKPITKTVEEGEKLVELAEAKNCKLQVGHIERFNPALLSIEHMEINPLFIESHRMANFNPRGTDVAVVLDLMIHDIDLILSFVKSPVKTIDASGASIISSSEDIANCRINFENGAVANVTASRISMRKMRKMRFFQPNAYISVDFLEGSSEVYQLTEKDARIQGDDLAFSLGEIEGGSQPKEIRYTRFEKKDINPLRVELERFILSILEDKEPAVSGADGVRALRVANAIQEDIHQHAETVKKHWSI